MNNYPSFQNYNYANMYNNMNNFSNNYNQKKNDNLFNPYNGFIRGNLFKNLFDPYKIKVPYDVKPMNEQAEILTNIDALEFSMRDLNLYLDVYPEDKKMITLYNEYRNNLEKEKNNYEAKYGPITLCSNSLNSYPWAWINMPWPWDN